MLVEETLFGTIDKVKIAIERAKEFEPREGYLLAFSGGKDSVCSYYILKMAGVKYRAVYSPTSVDPPELIYFIKEKFPDVEFAKYTETMWELIPRKLIPPTRLTRYCCDVMKERTGNVGDTVVVGVRWAESSKRKKLSMIGFYKGKVILRPIIEWLDEDVWEFIKTNGLPYCKLYDEGFKRIGCIGCPLVSSQSRELELYPKFKEAYIRAFNRMIENRLKIGKKTTWENGEEVMKWWTNECSKEQKLDNQCSMFE